MRCRACEFVNPEDGSQDILIRDPVCMVNDDVPDVCKSCNPWQEELDLHGWVKHSIQAALELSLLPLFDAQRARQTYLATLQGTLLPGHS